MRRSLSGRLPHHLPAEEQRHNLRHEQLAGVQVLRWVRHPCRHAQPAANRPLQRPAQRRLCSMLRCPDTLELDETDWLPDTGLMNALKDIIKCLPDCAVTVPRQSMVFSATIVQHA